jgi:hypothetical protein
MEKLTVYPYKNTRATIFSFPIKCIQVTVIPESLQIGTENLD